MSSDIADRTLVEEKDIRVPDYSGTGNESISIILLADKPSQLKTSFKSVVKLLLDGVNKNYGVKLDIMIAVREEDPDLEEYFLKWTNGFDKDKMAWKVSMIVDEGKMGKLLASAIGKATGEALVFLTPGFILDREALASELINQFHVPMEFGVSFVKGHYGVSNVPGTVSDGRTSSPAPYVLPPRDFTSFGGIREYLYYFPFRHLSTIRVKKSLVSKHLDFLSNFDQGLDIAMGAIAVHEGTGIKTSPVPFVNMLSTPPSPDLDVLKSEIYFMKSYFPDMNEYTGRAYFDYLEGAYRDVKKNRY